MHLLPFILCSFLLLKKKNKIHNAQLTFQSLLYLEILRTFYEMPAEFI